MLRLWLLEESLKYGRLHSKIGPILLKWSENLKAINKTKQLQVPVPLDLQAIRA